MMVSDETARKQICPHIRYCINESGVIQDGDAPIYTHANCQGSDCIMAWRWEARRNQFPAVHGYCGIAGKPEE